MIGRKPIEKVSFHGAVPTLNAGGTLEKVGDEWMLRMPDTLRVMNDLQTYKLTRSWQPGKFDETLYQKR
jgi:hypothetical protein